MRPTPVAAGFQLCNPGMVSRAANGGSSALARRDTLSAMPLAPADLTNSRREILIGPRLSPPEREVGVCSRCRSCAGSVTEAGACGDWRPSRLQFQVEEAAGE